MCWQLFALVSRYLVFGAIVLSSLSHLTVMAVSVQGIAFVYFLDPMGVMGLGRGRGPDGGQS